MTELAKGKAAVGLSDKRRRRQRRAARIAVAKPTESEEGRLLVQTAAEVEAAKSKGAQEPKTNATRPARQDFEGAARRSLASE